MNGRERQAVYGRSFIFGIEDGLVSTVGLLSGIAAAGVPGTTIVLTGVILVVVEALSMAVGSFLSEYSAEEYLAQKEVASQTPTTAGLVMFLAYIAAGLVPLAPYLFLVPTTALYLSILLTLLALFALGIWSARIVRLNLVRSGLRMLLAGGLAIAIGILVGGLVR